MYEAHRAYQVRFTASFKLAAIVLGAFVLGLVIIAGIARSL